MARRKEDRNSMKQHQKDGDSFEGVVFQVMPKEFLGDAVRRSVAAPDVAQKPPVVVPPPPPPPVVKVEPPKPPMKKKRRKAPVVLLIFGLLFLLGLSIAAVVVLNQLSEPEDIDVPIVEEPVVVPEEPDVIVPQITQGIDTDSDGLTDREESLYGTDARNPDTDGDTFLDGNEVFHRYDPLGFAPSTLLDTGSVVEYRSELGQFGLTYPRQWSLVSSDDGSITLRAQTGATVSVVTKVRGVDQDFALWLAAEYPAVVFSDLKKGMTKSGYESYATSDQRMAFLVFDSRVVLFTYTLGNSLVIDYLQTFQMMVNSFFLE